MYGDVFENFETEVEEEELWENRDRWRGLAARRPHEVESCRRKRRMKTLGLKKFMNLHKFSE